MKVILNKEPNFNFALYYEGTPFYPNTIEVKKGTVKGIKNLINCIL